jgi:hypothetical protein
MLYDPKWNKTETRPEVRVLVEARKLLDRPENWGTGDDVSFSFLPGSTMCVGIAMQCAAVGSGDLTAAAKLFEKANSIGSDGIGANIVAWNDAPGRTHAEVLAALDRAIAAAC